LHPLIHVVSLLVLSLGLALSRGPHWGWLLLFLPVYWLICGHGPGSSAWSMLKRLRWFLLSIVVVYSWFTPGLWIVSDWQRWSPTVEGAQLALHRLVVLIAIVLAVATLLKTLDREQLMAALRQLVLPLRRFGFPADRFALLLTLTLIASRKLAALGSPIDMPKANSIKQRLLHVVDRLYFRFREALIVDGLAKQIEIPALVAPPVWQWAWPGLILTAVVLVN